MTDATQVPTSTALALPDDIMADLLKAQAGSITTTQQLPDIGIMGAGSGLFEFSDNPGKTVSTFRGVVLNNHSRNILWDKPMGAGANNEKALPACSSNNGIVGVVRKGFAHAGLPSGEVGDGETVTVTCETCPYNKWGTGSMFKPQSSPKGKAVSNQRAVYIMMEGIAVPYRLVIPPTSLSSFDEYLMALVARRIPVQAVITEFSQTREEKNGQRYGVAHFAMVGSLVIEQFNGVMEMRRQWEKSISPSPVKGPIPAVATVEPAAGVMSAMAGPATRAKAEAFNDFPAALEDQADELPF